jgi:hypothetical protein
MFMLGFTFSVFEGKIVRNLIFHMNASSCHVLGPGQMARVSTKLVVAPAGTNIHVNSTRVNKIMK